MITDHRFFANFQKYRFLLNQLVKRDIQGKIQKFYLRNILEFFRTIINHDGNDYNIFILFLNVHTQLSSVLT